MAPKRRDRVASASSSRGMAGRGRGRCGRGACAPRSSQRGRGGATMVPAIVVVEEGACHTPTFMLNFRVNKNFALFDCYGLSFHT